MQDLSPVFSNLKEWNQLETIVDLLATINKLLKQTNDLFTMRSMFGNTLVDFFDQRLGSSPFILRNQLLNTDINFVKVLNNLF